MPGHVQRRGVRCGRMNCRCARGQKHAAFYHVWDADGQRYQKYVRRADVERVRAACARYRALQATLREGRAEYRQMLARSRDLLSFLTRAKKAGWL